MHDSRRQRGRGRVKEVLKLVAKRPAGSASRAFRSFVRSFEEPPRSRAARLETKRVLLPPPIVESSRVPLLFSLLKSPPLFPPHTIALPLCLLPLRFHHSTSSHSFSFSIIMFLQSICVCILRLFISSSSFLVVRSYSAGSRESSASYRTSLAHTSDRRCISLTGGARTREPGARTCDTRPYRSFVNVIVG